MGMMGIDLCSDWPVARAGASTYYRLLLIDAAAGILERLIRGLCVPWRILIVDDHPAVRHMLRSFFEALPEFLVCGEAENGQQGIEKAQQLGPDAIILDISMPVLNGLEAARILRSTLPGIHILMFTSFLHPHLSETALAAGASTVVSKSSSPAALIKALKELLTRAA